MMNPIISLLMTVAFGAIFLMVGILVCREAEQSISNALKECMAWGTGFFVAMSIQVLAIASL